MTVPVAVAVAVVEIEENCNTNLTSAVVTEGFQKILSTLGIKESGM